jgi:hypothetical protein
MNEVDLQRGGALGKQFAEPRQQPRISFDAYQVAARSHQRRDMDRGDAETAAKLHYGRASTQQASDHPCLGALVCPPEHLRPHLR